jgi:thiol:disulfide interchange protein DsbA
MRLIRTLLYAVAFGAFGFVAASASAGEPKDGVEYLTLPEAQNTDAGGKVEVTEFFAYYCPHCNSFEPQLAAWVRKQGDKIVFKRVHIANGPNVAPQQRLFYTLEALGLLDQYHEKVFAAMHGEGRQRLNTDQAVIEWAAGAGIDRAKFLDAWNSFGVQAKLRRANAMMSAYRIEEWPMVAVGGRYMTSPSRAGSASAAQTEEQMQQAALQVMDYLVAKAKAEKK